MALTTKRPSSGIDYSYDLEAADDATGSGGEVYVPLKKRREEQLKKLNRHHNSRSGSEEQNNVTKEPEFTQEELDEREKARKRMERTLLAEAQDVHKQKAMEGALDFQPMTGLEDGYDSL